MTEGTEATFERDYFANYTGHGPYRDSSGKRFFRTRLVRRYAQAGRLLELGCAYGFLLRALQKDFECDGIDISQHAIDAAREITTANFECGDINQLLPKKADGAYDILLAFDVLEHLPQEQIGSLLREMARVLRPDGVVLVSVPNTTCWTRSVKGADWAGTRDATHISLLSPQSWLELFRRHFAVVETGGDGLWDAPYLPLIPQGLQRLAFLPTNLLAGLTAARFPRCLSENLIIAGRKLPIV
jgi:SAM-dependent methyltransferase